ncbi:MAG: dihydroorotate dehydrogenase [Bacteroidales bacterium]
MERLKVNIGGLELKNPVTVASGTFGYGEEMQRFFDVSRLGAIFLKGLTLNPREGNDYPRMAETASGMLNAVGLQNKGVDHFIREIYPRISSLDTALIPNVNGGTIEEYVEVTEKLAGLENIPAIELNISCPNVKQGGMLFGTSCPSAIAVTEAVRKAWPRTLIVKLSPNVTDIAGMARAVEGAGADAISLINTLVGMAIDAKTRRPKLSTVTGGLSGPAIKPVALRMVWQCYQAVKIPIIGIGGIMNTEDAVEFIIAGASAVQVGTATFIHPDLPVRMITELQQWFDDNNIGSVEDLRGSLII